jgi:hypothetical protein
MTIQRTTALIATVGAVIAVALAGASVGTATSRSPELGNADPPAKVEPPTSGKRASFVLRRVSTSPCGTETYAIELNGRRLALVC